MKKGKKIKTMIIAGLIGFGLSMVIMAIMIYFGYTKAYSTNPATLDVKFFTLPIYILTNVDGKYTGESNGLNMGIMSTAFAIVGILIERVISVLGSKKEVYDVCG